MYKLPAAIIWSQYGTELYATLQFLLVYIYNIKVYFLTRQADVEQTG